MAGHISTGAKPSKVASATRVISVSVYVCAHGNASSRNSMPFRPPNSNLFRDEALMAIALMVRIQQLAHKLRSVVQILVGLAWELIVWDELRVELC